MGGRDGDGEKGRRGRVGSWQLTVGEREGGREGWSDGDGEKGKAERHLAVVSLLI